MNRLTAAGPMGVELAAVGLAILALFAVTVWDPTRIGTEPITVEPSQLKLIGNRMEQITVTNRSDQPQSIYFELAPAEDEAADCNIRYTPKHFRVAPGAKQIVHLLLDADSAQICHANVLIFIIDDQEPTVAPAPATGAQ